MSDNIFPLVTKNFYINPTDKSKLWTEAWSVCLKDQDEKRIGEIYFNEGIFHGEMQIKVELDPAYEKDEYNKEVFYAMSRFAFRFQNVREISTSCWHENEHRVKGLEKAGYIRREFKDGVYQYSMKKQKSSWTGLYVIIGMIAGFLIGIVVSNLWMGTLGGVIIGTVLGYIMDKRDEKAPV